MSEDEYNHAPGEDQSEVSEPLVDFLELCPRLVLALSHPVSELSRVHLRGK